MRVMISGGGTGGHIYPALSIAEQLKCEYPGAEILYVGAADGMEHRLAAEAGYDFLPISVAGLSSKNPLKVLVVLLKNALGVAEAKRAIRRFKPDLAVGTGGYACGPLLLAAEELGIPTLLHEQNAVMGKTNRILSGKVSKLCLTFPIKELPEHAAERAVLTGLPVRKAILQAERQVGRQALGLDMNRPVLLLTGGSQGARHLNQALAALWRELLAKNVQIVHICGEKLFSETAQMAQEHGLYCQRPKEGEIPRAKEGFLLLPYLSHMEYAMSACDVVVARAGASFLAELSAIGRAAVLVPYPYAAGNHQAYNAAAFAEAGAALVIDDAALSAATLRDALQKALFDIQLNQSMAQASAALGHRDAAAKILAAAQEIIG